MEWRIGKRGINDRSFRCRNLIRRNAEPGLVEECYPDLPAHQARARGGTRGREIIFKEGSI
jgi:hypothetical protein